MTCEDGRKLRHQFAWSAEIRKGRTGEERSHTVSSTSGSSDWRKATAGGV
jgi:hypothetical protein